MRLFDYSNDASALRILTERNDHSTRNMYKSIVKCVCTYDHERGINYDALIQKLYIILHPQRKVSIFKSVLANASMCFSPKFSR